MKNKTLSHYLKSRITNIQTILKKSKNNYTAETFHLLRVEIKKLNALQEMSVYFKVPLKPYKKIKEIHEIFTLAGKIRAIQIEMSLLNDSFNEIKIPIYLKFLKQKLNVSKTNYFNVLKKTTLSVKETFEKNEKALNLISLNNANKYVSKQKLALKTLLEENSTSLHKIRIKIKEMIYDLRLISTNDKDLLMQQFILVTEMLGSWHDLEMVKLNMIKSLQFQKDHFTFSNMTKILIKLNDKTVKGEIKIKNKLTELLKTGLLNQ